MKKLLFIFAMLLGLFAVAPVLAHEGECHHGEHITIASLRECVLHAEMEGHITHHGIVQSLLAKLNRAQNAYDRGQINGAINALNAFINEVQAQGGIHIVVPHDQHLIEHAQHVIHALGG